MHTGIADNELFGDEFEFERKMSSELLTDILPVSPVHRLCWFRHLENLPVRTRADATKANRYVILNLLERMHYENASAEEYSQNR